jgi:hypothetical protein
MVTRLVANWTADRHVMVSPRLPGYVRECRLGGLVSGSQLGLAAVGRGAADTVSDARRV